MTYAGVAIPGASCGSGTICGGVSPGAAGAAQIGQPRCADIAHAGAQPANKLVDQAFQRTAVGHARLDALGDQLAGIGDVLLAVAIALATAAVLVMTAL